MEDRNFSELPDCPHAILDFRREVSRRLQVLTMVEDIMVKGHQCHVTRTRMVTSCETPVDGQRAKFTEFTFTEFHKELEVTPGECRAALATGKMRIDGADHEALMGQRTTEGPRFTRGGIGLNGRCHGQNFYSEGKIFTNSYEQTWIKIKVKAVDGSMDLSTGQITFSNGLEAAATDGVIRDRRVGLMIWNDTISDCSSKLGELYRGSVQVHEIPNFHQETASARMPLGSVVVIQDPGTDRLRGFQVKKHVNLCGLECYATQAARTAICEQPHAGSPRIAARTMQEEERNLRQRGLSMSFVPQEPEGAAMTGKEKLSKMLEILCQDNMERRQRTLHVLLSTRPQGLVDLKGPGYKAIRTRKGFYLKNCRAEEAILGEHVNCTREIPVVVRGKRAFVQPLNLILQPQARNVYCSAETPFSWAIHEDLYCASPLIRPCGEDMRRQILGSPAGEPFPGQ